MAKQLGVALADIQKVQLAGAFGSYLNPANACRIGLLPEELLEKTEVVGNAAGSVAKMLACDKALLPFTQELREKVEFLELAKIKEFPRTFAKAMHFREEDRVAQWMEKAKEIGFDVAAVLNPQALVARSDIRAMCAEDKCGAYHRNWTCPPAVGTLEECQTRMRGYQHGILLQSIGHMNKTVDSKCYRETEQRHIKNFYAFAEEIRKEYPSALCLGAGGCRVCKRCAYPEPCHFPEKAVSSMEGYGLFVMQVCRDACVPYYHGEKTITYTACVLF
jgi:predicted metal-binding protein